MNSRDGAYPCDYGHNHLTAAAKQRCEDRNDGRGLPRAAREAKTAAPAAKPEQFVVDFGAWRS